MEADAGRVAALEARLSTIEAAIDRPTITAASANR
jgi:hypothetical protein